MSHFVIAVLTENGTEDEVAKLMAPYHEFECTGIDDEFVQDVDITEEARVAYKDNGSKYPEFSEVGFVADWYGLKIVAHGNAPDLSDEHKYGYVLINEDGSLLKAVNRTNPNMFWDWYRIGGRWDGYFFEGNRCRVSEFPAWPTDWTGDGKFFGLITPDGVYHSKGRGGWFGCVLDEKAGWKETESALLNAHPDSIAVVVDFHI